MKVTIEFELDTDGKNRSLIDDVIADWTYEMRTSRFLVPGSWKIEY